MACVPLFHGEHAVGVLAVASPKPDKHRFTPEDVETLRLLAQIIAIPLHRTRSFPRPRYDNTHDALTGLLNRRAFEERVKVELARRTRYDQSFSLALLDLDGFNTANDRFGEAAGDELLRTIGTILSQAHARDGRVLPARRRRVRDRDAGHRARRRARSSPSASARRSPRRTCSRARSPPASASSRPPTRPSKLSPSASTPRCAPTRPRARPLDLAGSGR